MPPVFSKYHLENVKALRTLNPLVRGLFYEFLVRIAVAGIRIRITAAYRTEQEENALYMQGRTKPGPIVTDVMGKDSWHCWGLAIDIAPMHFNGLWYSVDYSDATYEEIYSVRAHPTPVRDPSMR